MEKKVKSEIIYDGKIIKVYKDQVECPNKRLATREIVRHHGGVGILAVVDDCILLVKQFRYAYNKDTLEIPAGKLEANENPKDCAFRELEEETNNRAREMKFIMKVLPSPGYTSEWLYLYEAIDFEEVDDALEGDEDEFIDIVKLDIDEAYQKVLNGEIVDAKTVIAIMYAYQQVHL